MQNFKNKNISNSGMGYSELEPDFSLTLKSSWTFSNLVGFFSNIGPLHVKSQ